MATRGVSGERQRRRDEHSQQAVAAAVAVGRAHGLRTEEPVVLADLFSVMVHLRPAPVVARVPTWITKLRSPAADWLSREVAVATWLSAQGAPVVAPSPELPPGPHASGGFTVSFWTYVQPDPDRVVTAADCSAMLVDLHAVLRSYPGELPALAPAVIDIPRWLPMLDRASGLLSDADLSRLHAAAERLRPFLETPAGDIQPLHGDAHPGNLIATRNGPVWIDFEEVCRGPVEWDLASIGDAGAVAAHHQPDPALMVRCAEARALQVALVLIALYDDFGDTAGWDEGIRGSVDALAAPR